MSRARAVAPVRVVCPDIAANGVAAMACYYRSDSAVFEPKDLESIQRPTDSKKKYDPTKTVRLTSLKTFAAEPVGRRESSALMPRNV